MTRRSTACEASCTATAAPAAARPTAGPAGAGFCSAPAARLIGSGRGIAHHTAKTRGEAGGGCGVRRRVEVGAEERDEPVLEVFEGLGVDRVVAVLALLAHRHEP